MLGNLARPVLRGGKPVRVYLSRQEEFARRGDQIYETRVREKVEAGNYGKIVAIDIETGAFEVADEILTATDRLFERFPEGSTLDCSHWI